MFQNLKLTSQNKILIISFVVLLVLWGILSVKNKNAGEESVPEKNKTFYADTLIPKGFVLIPIELANFESVSALIDQFGVIDLYAGAPQMAGSVKVVSRVKILRAPLNPNLFAILVSENSSAEIMKKPGPFWAVVQNRQSAEQLKTDRPVKNVQIEYYKGG